MKIKNEKRGTPILLISLLIFSDSGCADGDNPEDKIVITFRRCFISRTIPSLNNLIEKYEKVNPGIVINAQYVTGGDLLIQMEDFISARIISGRNEGHFPAFRSRLNEDLLTGDKGIKSGNDY